MTRSADITGFDCVGDNALFSTKVMETDTPQTSSRTSRKRKRESHLLWSSRRRENCRASNQTGDAAGRVAARQWQIDAGAEEGLVRRDLGEMK